MIGKLTTDEITLLLSKHYIGHMACTDGETPYLVPVTYYYDPEEDVTIGYTAEGRKIDILRNNPNVCLAVSEIDTLANWRSVVAEGTFEELNGQDALQALQKLLSKLGKVINDDGHEKVEEIRDMARAKEDTPKVIYRIHLRSKHGRYERPDSI